MLLVEREGDTRPRIGESLAPAARRLFSDMGLLGAFEAQGHAPCYGNRAVWGGDTPFETDFLRDPDGHGWHLDRARFDAWLRDQAMERGAALAAPARVTAISAEERRWRVALAGRGGPRDVHAGMVIDAAGRAAPIARHLGARRDVHDRLVCGWTHGRTEPTAIGAGFTFVQADEHGWWYSAPLGENRRVLAFHTDADLPAAAIGRAPASLHAAALRRGELATLLHACRFAPDGPSGITAAQSAALTPSAGVVSGSGWLATGDAAASFDPLSAQGIFNALFTGLAAAQAADRHLSGDTDALGEYQATLADICAAYRDHLRLWYGQDMRWPHAPFWQRRHTRQRAANSATQREVAL